MRAGCTRSARTSAPARRRAGPVPDPGHPPARYACRGCAGTVVQAPAPARLIEGGLPTERLVAQVLVAKYADHCPLYRQVQGFARQNIELDRSTLAFWTGYAAAAVKPLWRWRRWRREELLRSGRLFVDETRAPVLDPGRGRTKTGYFRAIARDDRGSAAAIRRRSSTAMRPGAAPTTPSPCRRASQGSCRPTAMAPTRPWSRPIGHAGPSPSPIVGPTPGAGSSSSPRAGRRRSPTRRCGARQALCHRGRDPRPGCRHPQGDAPGAAPAAGLGPEAVARGAADHPRGPLTAGRGDRLQPQAFGRPHPLSSVTAASSSTPTRSSGRSGRSR